MRGITGTQYRVEHVRNERPLQSFLLVAEEGRVEGVEAMGEKVTGGERRLTMMLNLEVTRKMTAG